jgi:hypothetical protein
MGPAYVGTSTDPHEALHRVPAASTAGRHTHYGRDSRVRDNEVLTWSNMREDGGPVHQRDENSVQPAAARRAPTVGERVQSVGFHGARDTGSSLAESSIPRHDSFIARGTTSAAISSVEERVAVERHGEANKGKLSESHRGGNSDRVRAENENERLQSVSSGSDGNHPPQRTNGRSGSVLERAAAGESSDKALDKRHNGHLGNVAADGSVAEPAQKHKSDILSAQHKERSHQHVVPGARSGVAHRRATHTTSGKASGPAASVPKVHVQVHQRPSTDSARHRVAESNNPTLREREALIRQLHDRRLTKLTCLGAPFKKASSRLPSTTFEKKAPLHVKAISTWDRSRLMELAKSTPYYRDMYNALRYCYDQTLYEELATGPDLYADTKSRVSAQDVAEMVAAGILRKVSKGTIKRTGKLFTVYEEAKHRRRIIQWPIQLNDEIRFGFSSNIKLSAVPEQCAQIMQGAYVVCHDLAISYYQGELAEEVQPYYGIVAEDGTEYVATRMVMGGVPFAEVNDFALKVLAFTEEPEVTTITHIDNLRYVGPLDAVRRADKKFRERVEFVGAVINEDELTKPHQVGVFCGIRYNAENGTVSLTEKTVEKLNDAKAKLLAGSPTNEDVCVIFGLLLWASTVCHAPLAKFYMAIKFVRRRMSQTAKLEALLTDPAMLWSSARPHFIHWFNHLISNIPVVPLRRQMSRDVIVFTDASKSGYGGCFFDIATAQVLFTAGQWRQEDASKSINELELKAVALVLDEWAGLMGNKDVHLRVDNTTAKSALKKGRSDHHHLNEILLTTLPVIKSFKTFTVEYVKSEENVADSLSRGAQGDIDRTRRTAELVSTAGLGARSIG